MGFRARFEHRTHGVEGHAHRRQIVQERRGPRLEETGQPDARNTVFRVMIRPKSVRMAPHGGLTQIDGGDEAVKTAFRQHHVRNFPSQIRAVAQGHPHVGGGQRGESLIPSPSMATVWPSA